MADQQQNSYSPVSIPGWLRGAPRWMKALWPHWVFAVVLVVGGGINILDGMWIHADVGAEPLSGMAKSLVVLGRETQMLMGGLLVLVGIGLLWRLRTAWAFAVLVTMVTIGVNLSLNGWGPSLIFPAILLVALFAFRKHFTRRTILANYLVSFASIVAVLSYGAFGSYRLGSGFEPEISDVTTSIYYTIITLSTVGYGDFSPVTPETRWFVLSLIVVGMSIFATVIVSTLGPAIRGQLAQIFNPAVNLMKPSNHVILVGEGLVARTTAQELADRKIPFIQVLKPDGKPFLEENPVVHGEPDDAQVLEEAGIRKARMIIAALDDDGKNAFISLLAKDLNEEICVLAVAGSVRTLHLLKLARADMVFASAAVGSRLLANLVEGNEIPTEFQDLLEGQPEK